MAEFPALPLFTDRLVADCAHLSHEEFGLYMRLLILIWRSPECRIPNDEKWICKRMSVAYAQIEELIKEFCNSSGNFITQKTLREQFEYLRKKSKKNSGIAKSRWNKEKDICERSTKDMPEDDPQHCERNAPTTTPITIKKEDRGEQVDRTVGASRFTLAALPEDFRLFCLKERPDLNPETVFKKFALHWQHKSSTDWFSAWQKWVIDEHHGKDVDPPQEMVNPRVVMWIKHFKNGGLLEDFAMNELAKLYGEGWRETV